MSLDRKAPRGCRKAWNGGSPAAAIEAAKRRRQQLIAQGWTGCTACGGHGTIHWTPPANTPLALNGPEWSDLCARCEGKGLVPSEPGP